MSRLFRAEPGMTFPQLGAPSCGWSSASAFIDVFRRAFGHTPGSYARS